MQINQLQAFANSDSGAASNPHVWTTLYCDRLSVIDCNIICECSVTTTREGSPVVRLKHKLCASILA